MSHTPGPWSVFKAEGGVRLGVEADAVDFSVAIYGTNDDESGIYGRDSAEAKANAHLIAAAPDLLAAAQLALAVIDFCLPYITNESDRRVVAEQALRAAIAKAEGR